MAVSLPPWLSIDPIEPARLAAASAQRRTQAAIAERQAQLRQQEIDLRAQVESAQIAAQERAAYRRQLMADQLAQQEASRQAQEMEFRRQQQVRQAAQFQQSLQLRQDAAQRAAAEASIQAEGSRGLQADLDAGIPIEQALPKHAGKLFYRHPERMVPALKSVAAPGEPIFGKTPGGQEYVQDPRGAVHFPPRLAGQAATGPVRAEDVLDASGQPIGQRVIRGAGGGVHMMPRTELSPEGRIRGLITRLAVLKGQIEESTGGQKTKLEKQRDDIMSQLEQITAPRSPGKIDEAAGGEEEAAAPQAMGEEDMMDEGATATQEAVGDEGDQEE